MPSIGTAHPHRVSTKAVRQASSTAVASASSSSLERHRPAGAAELPVAVVPGQPVPRGFERGFRVVMVQMSEQAQRAVAGLRRRGSRASKHCGG